MAPGTSRRPSSMASSVAAARSLTSASIGAACSATEESFPAPTPGPIRNNEHAASAGSRRGSPEGPPPGMLYAPGDLHSGSPSARSTAGAGVSLDDGTNDENPP